MQTLKTEALSLKRLTLITDSVSGGHLLNATLQSMMLKQSEKKFYKGCQADNSLTMELEVRMPVLKSQKSISSSFQPPASTLHPRKFSYRHLSVSMSVMECREGRKEEGKKGQKGGMGAG